jgi:hypothetical protein
VTMSTVSNTTTDVRALAAAVRDGELTLQQREYLVTLLHSLSTAVTLAPPGTGALPTQRRRSIGLSGRSLRTSHHQLRRIGHDDPPERQGFQRAELNPEDRRPPTQWNQRVAFSRSRLIELAGSGVLDHLDSQRRHGRHAGAPGPGELSGITALRRWAI